jgi:hypothetical protein
MQAYTWQRNFERTCPSAKVGIFRAATEYNVKEIQRNVVVFRIAY